MEDLNISYITPSYLRYPNFQITPKSRLIVSEKSNFHESKSLIHVVKRHRRNALAPHARPNLLLPLALPYFTHIRWVFVLCMRNEREYASPRNARCCHLFSPFSTPLHFLTPSCTLSQPS